MQDVRKVMNYHWKRASDRWLRLRKKVYQFYKVRRSPALKSVLFIFGCQRSGTTLLAEIFERDFDQTRVYHEFSSLSSSDRIYKIRINPPHIVKKEIDKNRASLVVLKPLVESQNAVRLLNYFENSKALWVYRHYKDVALSNLTHWGIKNGINNLRPIVEGQLQNWRSENVSEETKHIVLKYFSENMNPYDAAALFWLVRNRLFFELNLDKHPAVMMCKYDALIDDPVDTMTAIYKFVGYVYPSHKIPLKIYATSKGKGGDIKLSKDIEVLCDEMLERLNRSYDLKQEHNTRKNKIAFHQPTVQ
jgi:sulfotransferase family protein